MYTRLFKRLHNKMTRHGIGYSFADNINTLFHAEAERTNQDTYYQTALVILDRNGVGLSFKNMILEMVARNPNWYAHKDVKKFVRKWASTEMGNKYYNQAKVSKQEERKLRIGDVLRVYKEETLEPDDEIIIDIEPPDSWGSRQAGIITASVANWNSTKRIQGEYIASDRWERLGRVTIDVNRLG